MLSFPMQWLNVYLDESLQKRETANALSCIIYVYICPFHASLHFVQFKVENPFDNW